MFGRRVLTRSIEDERIDVRIFQRLDGPRNVTHRDDAGIGNNESFGETRGGRQFAKLIDRVSGANNSGLKMLVQWLHGDRRVE